MKHDRRPENVVPYERSIAGPAPTVDSKVGRSWTFERPATTVAGDARLWPPGHKINSDDRRRHADADDRYGDRAGTDAIRLTPRDALILQSFPPDYPVQGSKTRKYKQIGDAVPPLLAAHVLATLLNVDLAVAA